MEVDGPAASAGSTVTLLVKTYTLGANFNFNPQTTQQFSGNMFMFDLDGTRVSDIVSAGAVPEPSTWALLGLSGVASLLVKRRTMHRLSRR